MKSSTFKNIGPLTSATRGVAARMANRLAQKLNPSSHSLVPQVSGFFAQGTAYEKFLTVEDSFEIPASGTSKESTLFVMKDGALGTALWLSPLSQEVLNEGQIKEKLSAISGGISRVQNPQISFQIIFDSEPDLDSGSTSIQRSALEDEKSFHFAQAMALKRSEMISSLASETNVSSTENHSMRLVRRRILLALRLEGQVIALPSGHELARAEKVFAARVQELVSSVSALNDVLSKAGIVTKNLNRESLVRFYRDSLHSLEERRESKARHEFPTVKDAPLARQCVYHTVEMTPGRVKTGCDFWQVASLQTLPESTFAAQCAKLLSLPLTHRIVFQFNRKNDSASLDMKRGFLRYATDAFGTRQLQDITDTQHRLLRDESLFEMSAHILVRNEHAGLTLEEQNESSGALRSALSSAASQAHLTFAEEEHCAGVIFNMCLPFQNSPAVVAAVSRSHMVLSENLTSLLPLYGGFRGTKTPLLQMQSRGGERIFLNPRDSNGSSHIAVLGASGAGKSVAVSNLCVGFMAAYPESRVFIIDKKTSYSVLATLAQEQQSASILKPPQNFPNIFQGGLDEDRLPSIVHILQTAMLLLSPKAEIGALETRVLADALKLTFEEKKRQAGSVFNAQTGTVQEIEVAHVDLPTLSEVVRNLPGVCDALEFSPAIAQKLADLLSPFVGAGPYSRLFDVASQSSKETQAPLLTLCDLESVSGDPVLMVLTVQALILEILRLVRPQMVDGNMVNPPSLLVIEEVGVLASESPALVSFIRDAWKTLRKYNVTCVGVTNDPVDFLDCAGPREIWNISPNKMILTQTKDNLDLMESRISEGKSGLVPSVFHCQILRSLSKKSGKYADAFWMNEETSGSYTFVPTGFDYWCAVSSPIEVATVEKLAAALCAKGNPRPVFSALDALASLFTMGVHDGKGPRPLSATEFEQAISLGLNAEVLP